MGKASYTKDEKFLMALYENTKDREDPEEPVDGYAIGATIGMATRQVDAICTQLMRANFIKRVDKHFVYLTPHGVKLTESLIDQE